MNDDHDVQLLEDYLDAELSADECETLRARLTADPALAAELDVLRAHREMRQSVFVSLEGDSNTAEMLLTKLRDARAPSPRFRRLRYALAAAACIALSFLAGWMGGMNKSSDAHANPSNYRVEIRDDAGQVLAAQKFDSFEKARAFSQDLADWQKRQEQIFSGQVTVRSASY